MVEIFNWVKKTPINIPYIYEAHLKCQDWIDQNAKAFVLRGKEWISAAVVYFCAFVKNDRSSKISH